MKKLFSFLICILLLGRISAQTSHYDTIFVSSQNMDSSTAVFLQAESIRGLAKIFINGQFAAMSSNEFIPLSQNITSLIKQDTNVIRFEFINIWFDTTQMSKERQDFFNSIAAKTDTKRSIFRMAQYNFGWDFCRANLTPNIVNLKITKRQYPNSKPDNIATDYWLGDTLAYSVSTDSIKNDTAFMLLSLETGKYPFKIANPRLWYPNTMGESVIYTLPIEQILNPNQITDCRNFIAAHKILPSTIRFAIRTIRLVEDTDSIGRSFYFEVNSVPMFARGSNVIMTEDFDTTLLRYAKEANCNMLRLWGGGRYADERFLTWCDENGILVWQDFPFACAPYPADSAFLNEIKTEVKSNLERMKRHPCLALLCGNNENWEGINQWGWKTAVNDSNKLTEDYNILFKQILADLAKAYCPDVSYIHTSPLYGWGRQESYRYGDSHYWGVWWADSNAETYTRKVGRFVSEYGFQSPPTGLRIENDTIKTDLEEIKNRFKEIQFHPRGFEIIAKQIKDTYGSFQTINDFLSKNDSVAMKAYRIAIEAHRRKKPYCMGSLTWQWNEPEYAYSWAAIDGSGTPKAVYQTIKESFKPLILSVDVWSQKDKIAIWYCNDLLYDLLMPSVDIIVSDNNGKTLYKHSIANVKAESNKSHCIATIPNRFKLSKKRNQIKIKVVATAFDCKTNKIYDILAASETITKSH
ncbi:MAG: hypothetical protein LBL74_00535 [Bacteroidales bacterium]|jgi:beta-mannosidase|nr:hypothetical protein [Bacteroidales bacterium]